MQDGQNLGLGRQAPRTSGGVASFASDVISRLVTAEVSMTTALREDLIERFTSAVVKADLTDFETLRPELRRARISPSLFTDRYLPEIARRLGKAWEDDTMTFAEVTMGSARLQAILRQVGAGWIADAGSRDAGMPTVLLIVPNGQQHTLGAFVVLGQLRRKGISVCLRVGPTEGDLRALFASRRFDAAMLSLALPDELGPARKLMASLKDMTAGRLPIALGGAALAIAADPAALTAPEAEIVTNDLTLAISALGLLPAAVTAGV
jgi:MerR family transcriptional regulator, light-induced transcriptional regulator